MRSPADYEDLLAELDHGRAAAYELGHSAAFNRVKAALRRFVSDYAPGSSEWSLIQCVLGRVRDLEGRRTEDRASGAG